MRIDRFRWIVDGHNLLLTHHDPLADPRPDAPTHAQWRAALEETLERFALHHGIRMCLVYDGKRLSGGHPGARPGHVLEVLYSDPPAEADDLISQRAARWNGDGGPPPAVVTSDRRTLVPRLGGVRVVSSEDFARLLNAPADAQTDTPARDLELEAMLLDAAAREPASAAADGHGASPARMPAGSPQRRRAVSHRLPAPDRHHATVVKRERGRRRQEKRLARLKRRPRR
jgi:predicted RNA-binding protein with PIN domain